MRGRSNASCFASRNDVANQATRRRPQASLASGASIIFSVMIKRYGGRVSVSLMVAMVFALAGVAKLPNLRAQELDIELISTAHLLPDVGPGLRAIHRDASGRFYVLTAPGTFISMYSADGKTVGRIPAVTTKEVSLQDATDFDLDSSGRVVVADRGANAIKTFNSAGHDQNSFPVTAPAFVAALSSGEIAVASLHSRKLVEIYDKDGRWLRNFGERTNLADHSELNRSLNLGKLIADPTNHLYYAFSYLPEPTVRRYDHLGNTSLEISLSTLEFAPVAEATRHQISEQDQKPGAPIFKPVINAVGVDPQSLDVWIAMDDELTHFDREGSRRGETYRTYTAQGDRVVPISILVEPDHLILAGDPVGVYLFPRPDKAPGIAPEKTEEKPAAVDRKP
jgi:hypothetical protein